VNFRYYIIYFQSNEEPALNIVSIQQRQHHSFVRQLSNLLNNAVGHIDDSQQNNHQFFNIAPYYYLQKWENTKKLRDQIPINPKSLALILIALELFFTIDFTFG
jgi:hypothetical protein